MTRFIFAPVLSALVLTACAAVQPGASTLPTDAEVVAYVTTNWSSYDRRLAFLAGRRGQSPSLVSVTDVECREDDGDAACTFVAEGRFSDGTVLRQPMESAFQRQSDGSIEMLIPVAAR